MSSRKRSRRTNNYNRKSRSRNKPLKLKRISRPSIKLPTSNNEQLTYLSLFSGIGGFEQGIRQIFPNAKCLGYSEINPSSIKIYEEHFPDHKNLGDVRSIKGSILESLEGKVDLLVGGSPCQNFSNAGNRMGLEGEKSSLLMEYIRILDQVRPKYFILENVKMSQEHQDQISELLGFDPVLINSNIASYQTRKRLYWCNFDIADLSRLPPIKGTVSNILLESGSDEAKEMVHKTIGNRPAGSMERRIRSILSGKPIAQSNWFKIIKKTDKSVRTLNRSDAHYEWIVIRGSSVRQIHPIERERLQTFPDNWTASLSKTKRYEVLGDAVTCNVISLIVNKLRMIRAGKNPI